MKRLLFLLVFPSVLALDYFSKQYAIEHQSMLIWNSGFGVELYLHYVENTGAAWGMLADYAPYLLWFRIGVVVILLCYLLLSRLSKLKVIAVSLLIGGAFCNVMDCVLRGYVIDMIHFLFWENSYGVFNVADTAIFLGVIGLMIKQQQKKKKPCLSRGQSR